MRVLIFIVLVLSGCASGHCDKNGKAQSMNQARQKVFVFKYDGSKQCEDKDSGTNLEEMASELSDIKVFSMAKRSDGQIRVQVCGALTGMANVYEISLKDLPKAEALGFKKWGF